MRFNGGTELRADLTQTNLASILGLLGHTYNPHPVAPRSPLATARRQYAREQPEPDAPMCIPCWVFSENILEDDEFHRSDMCVRLEHKFKDSPLMPALEKEQLFFYEDTLTEKSNGSTATMA